MTYNLERFNTDDYDFYRFDGPRAGEQALDFTLYDTEGNPVSLSDYKGKWLVLEMGAVSCNMFARNIKTHNLLQNEYPDVEFLVVYVREPHPGEKIGPHKSFEEKIKRAKSLEPLYGEHRKVLVDSVDGEMHTKYGSWPNSVYVINPDGKVIYRCNWIITNEVRKVLDNRNQINNVEHADMTVLDHPSIKMSAITLGRAGWRAILDFIKMIPRLHSLHKKVDEYYAKHGQLARGNKA